MQQASQTQMHEVPTVAAGVATVDSAGRSRRGGLNPPLATRLLAPQP
jgi:hypothetical protein